MNAALAKQLVQPADTKLVVYVFDGLGGLPNARGRTELEDADTKHLDRMAEQGSLGQMLPVAHGVTPGPATAFLALLGYDPLDGEIDEGSALEPFGERWDVKAAVVTASEMHAALAVRAGVPVIEADRDAQALVDAMSDRWDEYEAFFVHCVALLPDEPLTRYAAKRQAIADFDGAVPTIVRLRPEVLIVTGDRSAPALEGGVTTWHPVPLLINGLRTLPDESHYFSELGGARGVLGTIRACDVLPLALAHAGRLGSYGL
jgi:2,3-bisphosphoglycerate-independent phosphoglycerate mutase